MALTSRNESKYPYIIQIKLLTTGSILKIIKLTFYATFHIKWCFMCMNHLTRESKLMKSLRKILLASFIVTLLHAPVFAEEASTPIKEQLQQNREEFKSDRMESKGEFKTTQQELKADTKAKIEALKAKYDMSKPEERKKFKAEAKKLRMETRQARKGNRKEFKKEKRQERKEFKQKQRGLKKQRRQNRRSK